MNPYRELFRAMNDAGIRYLVVGGVAVNLHGYRRFTADVDILLALDEVNLEKMTTLMHSLDYVERIPVALKTLKKSDELERLLKEKNMIAYTFLSNKRERIDVDVLTAASVSFPEFNDRKIVIDLDEDVQVPVISLNDLIVLKQEANREKDAEDVRMLLELKQI